MVRTTSVGLLLVVAGLVAGCGDDGGDGGDGGDAVDKDGRDGAGGSSSVTVTRDDGTTFETGDLAVTCDGTGDEASMTVTSAAGRDPDGSTSFLVIQIPLEDAEGEHPLPWKVTVDDSTGAAVFVYDSETTNELSSDVPDASGAVSITAAECGEQPRFEADIDVTLGSEQSDGQPSDVAGEIALGG